MVKSPDQAMVSPLVAIAERTHWFFSIFFFSILSREFFTIVKTNCEDSEFYML